MAGGQDMPGGKTRDQWKRQQERIAELEAELHQKNECVKEWKRQCGLFEAENERLREALEQIAKTKDMQAFMHPYLTAEAALKGEQ